MNDQRRAIYEQRSDIMDSDDVTEIVEDMRSDTVNTIVADACPQGSYPEQWDIEGMKTRFAELLNLEVPLDDWLKEDTVDIEMIKEDRKSTRMNSSQQSETRMPSSAG